MTVNEQQKRGWLVLVLVLVMVVLVGWVVTAVSASTQNRWGEEEAGVTAVTQLIPDGSFENNSALWVEGDLTSPLCPAGSSAIGDWSGLLGLAAYDGAQSFLAGGYCNNAGAGQVRSNYVEQRVTVPSDVSGVSFWFAAFSDNPTPAFSEDTAYIEFYDPANQAFYPGTVINIDETVVDKGWLHDSVDIAPFAGKEIIIRFGVFNGNPTWASSVLFDFIEWGEAPAVSTRVDPLNGGQLDYSGPKGLTTQVIVPGGAVSQTTSIWYRPAGSPGFPLNSVGPLGGTALTYAGIAFDLDAFDEFVYLPLITQNSGSGNGQNVFGLETAVPQTPAETTSFFFNTPISITIHYDDTDLPVPEDQLYLYYWDPEAQMWKDAATTCSPVNPYVRNDLQNTFTLTVCHFSRFSVVGI